MRVLQIIAGMNIGGAENVVQLLLKTLDRNRFGVGLCCTRALGVLTERLRTEAPDVEVMLAAPSWKPFRYLAPFALQRKLAAFRPDVVHTHGTAALLHAGPLAMFGLLPPWIHTFHFGNYDRRKDSRAMAAERFLSRYPSQLIAVSDSQRESIIRRHRVPDHRIVTIVNGVSPAAADRATAARKRAELGFAPDDLIVGTIAVFSEQKGLPYLLRAIRRLVDRGTPARFLLVGGGTLEPSLRAEADALGLGSHVVFTGWRQDGRELMSVLDVFVMSSLWEAMPMALLEAMAARRAVVATDVGDNRKILDDGRCGLIVPPRDDEALEKAMARFVADDRLRQSLGEAACERHHAHYSVERMMSEYESLYLRVAS